MDIHCLRASDFYLVGGLEQEFDFPFHIWDNPSHWIYKFLDVQLFGVNLQIPGRPVVWKQGRQLLHGHLESSCCLEIRFRCLAMFGSWKVHRISQLCFVPSFVMCFFMLLSDPCWSSLLSSQLLWSILSGWVAWLSHQSEHLSACFNPNVGWLHIWLILFQLRRSLSESDLLMLFYIILPVRYFFLRFVLHGLAMFSHTKFGIRWSPPGGRCPQGRRGRGCQNRRLGRRERLWVSKVENHRPQTPYTLW